MVRYGGLARWSLAGDPVLLARAQTRFSHFDHLAISPNSEWIAVGSEDEIEIRRWNDLGLVSTIKVLPMAGDDDTDQAAIARFGAKNPIVTTEKPRCRDLAFSSGGLLAAAVNRNQLVNSMGQESAIGDFNGLVSYAGSRNYFLDCATGQTVNTLPTIGTAAWLAFAPDGSTLACGGEGGEEAGNPRLWVYRAEGDAARPKSSGPMETGKRRRQVQPRYWARSWPSIRY